jgi:heat shock protein HslJ
MAYAGDLKSSGARAPCRFKSGPGHVQLNGSAPCTLRSVDGVGMLAKRFITCLILVLVGSCVSAQTKQPVITVTGRLTRAVAIGGESTGWMIQLDAEITIDGKQISSIEVDDPNTERLTKLENKRVIAMGNLSHRHGVETGERTVLEIRSITEPQESGEPSTAAFSLSHGDWLLEDLGGRRVLARTQPTLSFPEPGKIAGNGSCNRFFGQATVDGNTIQFGPLASSQMACSEAVMNQEMKYLRALQAAERFEWKDPYLLIYCKGFEKPLRFKHMPPTPRSNEAPH